MVHTYGIPNRFSASLLRNRWTPWPVIEENADVEWLIRGCQKRAVARVLQRPMTATEILQAARPLSPHLTLRDIWFLMREFRHRNIAARLNPDEVTGKLFFLTDYGRELVYKAFDLDIPPPPADIDWRLFTHVIRATNRKAILLELAKPRHDAPPGRTAAQLRRALLENHAMSLGATIGALSDLRQLGLIGLSKNRVKGRRAYILTSIGERVRAAITE